GQGTNVPAQHELDRAARDRGGDRRRSALAARAAGRAEYRPGCGRCDCRLARRSRTQASSRERARIMTPPELLEGNGIQLKSYAPGNHSRTCPRCSAKRSKMHQKTECLSVKIDAKGATWYCHHCGWSGPGKGQQRTNSHGGGFAATYDYEGFQKVRYPKGHVP